MAKKRAKKSSRDAMRANHPRYFDNTWVEGFVDGAARAFWVMSWVRDCEERGKSIGSTDLEAAAPDTPLDAYVKAGELIGALQTLNKVHITVLGARAARADTGKYDVTETDAEGFGWYLAMMAMGEGVGWFDDHKSFKLQVPHIEDYNPIIP